MSQIETTQITPSTLIELRKEIDALDKDILKLLAQRISIIKEVVKVKQHQDIPVIDTKREQEVRLLWEKKASELGIDEQNLIKILEAVLHMAREEQSKIISEHSER